MEWKKCKMNLNHDIGIRCVGSWSCFILYSLLLSLTFTTFTYFHSHLFYLQTESFSHLNWKITSTKAFEVLVVGLFISSFYFYLYAYNLLLLLLLHILQKCKREFQTSTKAFDVLVVGLAFAITLTFTFFKSLVGR